MIYKRKKKKGKSAGVDNIRAELVQIGRKDVITALTTICNKIWQTGEWPTPWTQSLVTTLPKKSNMQQCQNYRTNSFIGHPSKAILKILLNRLKPQAEKIIADEQAGFRAGRSTTEQTFNLRILCEKYLQHHRLQEGLRHGFPCSFVGSHEEVQYQRQPYSSHETPSWSPTGMSTLTHPLQRISGNRRLRRSRRHSQRWEAE